jgi:hypothetical protein
MAEHIKFRLTAAKASVTLALLALVGGLPGAAGAKQSGPAAGPASSQLRHPIYIKLTGLSGELQKALTTLEYKLNNALETLTHKVNTEFYDKHKINSTFLKIDAANKLFYKESQVNATFLKIEDANASFLKITDAGNEFLKVDGTAANAQKLGGMTSDQFFQGRGNVLTNELTVTNAQQTLMADGSVKVLIALDQNSGLPAVQLENDTSSSLNFTVNNGGRPGNGTIAGNGGQTTVVASSANAQLDFQIFASGGGGGAGKVWTATLSAAAGQGGTTVVGQLLIGLL